MLNHYPEKKDPTTQHLPFAFKHLSKDCLWNKPPTKDHWMLTRKCTNMGTTLCPPSGTDSICTLSAQYEGILLTKAELYGKCLTQVFNYIVILFIHGLLHRKPREFTTAPGL